MWMTRVAINHPVFATMVMVALTVLGIFSYQRLRVEAMPDGMHWSPDTHRRVGELLASEVLDWLRERGKDATR